MDKVRLKITPSLASLINEQSSDWIILEKEVGESAAITDLLADVAFGHTDFRKALFDSETRKVSDEVMVVLNGRLLQFPGEAETKLKSGDDILLLLAYSGG